MPLSLPSWVFRGSLEVSQGIPGGAQSLTACRALPQSRDRAKGRSLRGGVERGQPLAFGVLPTYAGCLNPVLS